METGASPWVITPTAASSALLFHVAGGLQIWLHSSANVPVEWSYIYPELGYAVVNLEDTVVEGTGGLIRSALHRVVDPPGDHAAVTRQSGGYFVRPARKASMRRLQGGGVIPPLAEGEVDETPSVDEWAVWRSQQIMKGELNPQTSGGAAGLRLEFQASELYCCLVEPQVNRPLFFKKFMPF
jgi:hypothetical protein